MRTSQHTAGGAAWARPSWQAATRLQQQQQQLCLACQLVAAWQAVSCVMTVLTAEQQPQAQRCRWVVTLQRTGHHWCVAASWRRNRRRTCTCAAGSTVCTVNAAGGQLFAPAGCLHAAALPAQLARKAAAASGSAGAASEGLTPSADAEAGRVMRDVLQMEVCGRGWAGAQPGGGGGGASPARQAQLGGSVARHLGSQAGHLGSVAGQSGSVARHSGSQARGADTGVRGTAACALCGGVCCAHACACGCSRLRPCMCFSTRLVAACSLVS